MDRRDHTSVISALFTLLIRIVHESLVVVIGHRLISTIFPSAADYVNTSLWWTFAITMVGAVWRDTFRFTIAFHMAAFIPPHPPHATATTAAETHAPFPTARPLVIIQTIAAWVFCVLLPAPLGSWLCRPPSWPGRVGVLGPECALVAALLGNTIVYAIWPCDLRRPLLVIEEAKRGEVSEDYANRQTHAVAP